MTKWKVAAGILLIFALGGLTGAIGTGLLFKNRIHRFMDPKGPPPPIRILQRTIDGMNLSDDQRLEIDKLLDEMHREATKHFRQSVPKLIETFEQYTLKIREALTPLQQEELDKTLKRMQRRMRHMKPPPPPGQVDIPPPPRFTDREATVERNPKWTMYPPIGKRLSDIPAPGQFQEELDLTPEQVEKSDAIVQKRREKRKALRHRFYEEREQKMNEMESAFNRLDTETKANLSEVLSENQMKKFESLSAADKNTAR